MTMASGVRLATTVAAAGGGGGGPPVCTTARMTAAMGLNGIMDSRFGGYFLDVTIREMVGFVVLWPGLHPQVAPCAVRCLARSSPSRAESRVSLRHKHKVRVCLPRSRR